ncbi:Lysophospholipase L1 [Priestia filamentosa]|nr:Lysophospholipase L1 [Priestia filamentosa]
MKKMKKKIHFICLLLLLLSLSIGGIRVQATSSISQSYKSKVAVYLVGDSTVSTYDSSVAPRAGWGQVFEEEFRHKVTVRNEAQSGRSSKSFIDEGRLDAVLSEIQKGDYLFIQFGHNDEKIEDPSRYTEPSTTYKSYLKQYIDGARAKKATPILITPVERRRFTEEGIAYNSHGTYPQAMKELGKEENVPVIDLTEKSKALYQELGIEKTKDLFLWLEKGEHPNYPDGVIDNTHFQGNGAREISHLVAEGVKELKIVPLKNYLNKE